MILQKKHCQCSLYLMVSEHECSNYVMNSIYNTVPIGFYNYQKTRLSLLCIGSLVALYWDTYCSAFSI